MAWLWPLILPALKWIGHQVSRAWGVFLVAAIIGLIAMRWFGFKANLCNTCYKRGYSQALTDHPTQSGTIYNNLIKVAGVEVDNFGFGFWHRR